MFKSAYPSIAIVAALLVSLSNCQSPKVEEKAPAEEPAFSYHKEQQRFKKASDGCRTDSNECAIIEIDFPQFREPAAVFQKINDSILHYIKTSLSPEDMGNVATLDDLGNRFIQDYNEYTAEAKTRAEEDNSDPFITPWSIETYGIVTFESPKLVSIELSTYSYTGGAHPNTTVTLLNYDTKTGKAISIKTLIKDQRKLVQLAEKKFRETHELAPNASLNEEGFFWDGKFQLPENIGLSGEGIWFFYNSYEIAAYAVGPTEFVLSWEELGDLVNMSKVK